MVVQHNLSAMNSNRTFNIVNDSKAKSTEKLSSGFKINRAADDAAGLAISEKMRRQIRGLTQASSNCQDGVSFCQIADGALNEVDSMLERLKQLSIQAANGSNTDKDREYLNSEVQALATEIDRVHTSSTFNEIRVFTDDGEVPPSASRISLNIDGLTVEFELVGNTAVNEVQGTGAVDPSVTANSSMTNFVINAAADAIAKLKTQFPNAFATGGSTGVKIGLSFSPMDGRGGTLAVAKLQAAEGGGATMLSYNLNVDPVDYPPASFNSTTDAQKAELAATIAHEMTHMFMYDVDTSKMLGGSGSFPKWFVEGVAQTSSGDDGWTSGDIDKNSTDAEINAYMADLSSTTGKGQYGVGYLASMYLGHLASGASTISETSIKTGLDELLALSADPSKTFDDVINEATGGTVTSVADFEAKFKAGAFANQLSDIKDILNSTYGGAGSLLHGLGTAATTAFPPTISGSVTDYAVDGSASWFSNQFGTSGAIAWPTDLGPGSSGDAAFFIQAGSENDEAQRIGIRQFNMSAMSIFGQQQPDVSTTEKALKTVDMVKQAGERVSYVRSYYGATQNRLEHTIKNLDNVVENTTAAESSIRDTDMATEMVKLSNENILAQAGISMLTQANQANQNVLSLLQ